MKIKIFQKKIKIPKKLLFLFSLFLLIVLFRWFGWRFFGFVCCAHPSDLKISDVYVTDDIVFVHGYSREVEEPDASISFSGYKYDICGDKMYIGLKPDYFSGLQPEFKIEFSDEIFGVNNIYFTNGNHDEDILVWNRQKDGIYFERFVNVKLFREMTGYTLEFYHNLSSNEDCEMADSEFLNLIRRPVRVELSETRQIEDDYIAAAETKTGSYEILHISNDGSSFFVPGSPYTIYYLK